MEEFIKTLKKHKYYIPIVLVVIYGVYARFQDLGYSDYQGDENNTIRFIGDLAGSAPPLNEFVTFIIERRRGPIQYIINYINLSLFGHNGPFQVRLPYLIFGILAIVTFYILAKKVFDKHAAIWTTLFISINGLYLAFARITQYQAFMYFLLPISIYLFIKGFYDKNYKKLIISALLLSLNLLGHYDTLSAGPFFVGFIFAYLYKKANIKEFYYSIKSSLIYLFFFLAPALAFYLPFVMGSSYESSTSEYLSGRIFGSGFMPRMPLLIDRLLTMYVPVEGWVFLFGSIVLGLAFMGSKLDKIKIFKFEFPRWFILFGYYFSVGLLAFAMVFSMYPIKPRTSTGLVYIASMGITGILILSKKVKSEWAGIAFWFLFTLSFYFYFMKDPRTHVYNVFIPGFILAGYGIKGVFDKLANYKLLKGLVYTIILGFVLYLSAVNWAIFVDKNPEYPWWHKSVFGRQLYEIGKVRHDKIEGVFGFNNYRHWAEIRALYEKGCLKGTYNSNEKNSITRFNMGFDQTTPKKPDFIFNADTLIGVEGPHSWYYSRLFETKPAGYNLIKTFKNKDYIVTYIWGDADTYPNGEMLCTLN